MDAIIAQKLTPRVETALKKVLTADGEEGDAFDATDFDPIAFINKQFPNEASLGKLDGMITTMDTDIKELDESILGECCTCLASAHAPVEPQGGRGACILALIVLSHVFVNASSKGELL